MRELRTWRRGAAIVAVLALTATACGGDDGDDGDDGGDAGTATDEMTDGETSDPDAGGEVTTGTGITEEPCPDAVNEDNGCIYLGILSDLTEGPFAALANPIVAGQQAFWNKVNEDGGIAGYDVDIDEYTRDNKYNPQTQVTEYQAIEGDILALAQSLGTPPTLASLDLFTQDDVLAVPASWWSGWSVDEADNSVILESGQPYCIESMNGLDWWVEQGNEVASVMAVGYPGDYGGDGAAGAEAWANANDVEWVGFTQTAPNATAGNQDAAVGAILSASPDVVQIGTGPSEMAEIVGKAVAQGFEGQFLGSVPTWNPALLGSDAAPAIQASYLHVGPWGSFGSDSAAHDAMAAALGEGELPENDGYTFGWIWSYPLKTLLETAAENGDLTREGLLAAVDGLQVSYEGALPDRDYGGEPNETVPRSAFISQPDPEADMGITTLEGPYTGPTAESYEFNEPCVVVE